MAPKFESGPLFAQDIQLADVKELIEAEEYQRALSWTEAKIFYIEAILREMPTNEAEAATANISDWHKLRTDLLEELESWKRELEVIKNIIITDL